MLSMGSTIDEKTSQEDTARDYERQWDPAIEAKARRKYAQTDQ